MLSRRTILLKPMQPSLSGYARLQTEGERTLLQLHARGLDDGAKVRLYWYLKGQSAQELARAEANAHGEVSVESEGTDAKRLQAVILISDAAAPRPLLIGLCTAQTDGALLDAKNAALALCERLASQNRPTPAPRQQKEPAPPPPPAQAGLPREVFLPAIDPSPYLAAAEEAQEEFLPPPTRSAPPVDRLKPLKWPRGYESLKPYFENALPTAIFDLPGWRFVHAADGGGPQGLWLGIQQRDGQVCGVAYAHRGDTPPGGVRGWRKVRGSDGEMYQAMFQSI